MSIILALRCIDDAYLLESLVREANPSATIAIHVDTPVINGKTYENSDVVFTGDSLLSTTKIPIHGASATRLDRLTGWADLYAVVENDSNQHLTA